MRILTRGLGGGQGSGLILHGMTFEVIRIIRGGRTLAKDVYENLIEEFTIAAKLLQINGKELFAPIINRRKYIVDESVEHTVRVNNISVNKRKENTRVLAKLLKINRGSNGEN